MALRVAVIGAGHIGRFHLEAYAASPDAEIVAVCDSISERAEAAAARYGGRAYTSVAEMLAGAPLDAVSVCTAGEENGSHHFEPVMQCFEAGKHVLCEKPLSNKLSEARQMAARAREKGLYFGCDLNHRFTPQAARAKEWVEEGRLGTLLLANMTLWINNPNDRSPWFHLRALHPHSLDVLRYYCGRAVRVHGFFNRAPRADSPDGKRLCWSGAQINVLFANNVVGHLTGSYEANMRLNLERCEVMGTEGRFVIDNCYQQLTLYPRRSQELTVLPNDLFWGIPNFDATIPRRIQRWIEQVNAGVPREQIEASGEDGLAVQEIIEAAIASWENNCVVDVENG
ncbi:MAG TPA: Gfo/Idh/MocA family oxidoreductase [Chthonomonadaceae bacterium]|nr:Gfo/Idh/MocA family oxidoreductase [Chthonomonadaceae bacterium]